MKSVVLLAISSLAVAEVPAQPLAKKGALLFADDFSRESPGQRWRSSAGAFAIADGVLRGRQVRGDHPGIGSAAVAFGDAIIEFKFRLEGAASFGAVCDDKAYTGSHAGHICRVTITPKLIRLGDDKEGGMRNDIVEMRKDPARRAAGDKLMAGRTAAFLTPIEPHRWYRLTMELAGDQMRVSLDEKPIGCLKSPGLAHPTKSHFHFGVSGKDALFDDVRVWAAEPIR